MNIQFIYDVIESNYSNLECYAVYDFDENKLVQDVKLNKTLVMLDRKNNIIYFMGMETETHWILQKSYFYKIIQEFLKQVENYGCKNYLVYESCTGGRIYYKLVNN